MVQVEGTYWCVKKQDFVDFYVHLGVPKEKAQKGLNTHWSMKVSKHGDVWSCHVTCKELPHLNNFDTATEGVEKHFEHPLVGGKAKMTFKRNGDRFTTITESDKFGKMVSEELYTDEGLHLSVTCQGKTIKEFWERCVKVDGAYIFDHGENVENYFKAVGAYEKGMMDYLKTYKMHVCKKGNHIHTREWWAGKAICNKLELDVEGPFHYPDDEEGKEPKRRGVMTKVGIGKFKAVTKDQNGRVEEWNYTFTDCGVVLCGTDKKTNTSCKFVLKRFHDLSGTYKVLSMPGFEKFATSMGLPASTIRDITTDTCAHFKICDFGNGCHRHRSISKLYSADISFKLDHEFSFYHALLKENVKAVATQAGCLFTMTFNTSKGIIINRMHVNENFTIVSVCHAASHTGYKLILEREWDH